MSLQVGFHPSFTFDNITNFSLIHCITQLLSQPNANSKPLTMALVGGDDGGLISPKALDCLTGCISRHCACGACAFTSEERLPQSSLGAYVCHASDGSGRVGHVIC